jgi:acyl-ACP thioesterase
MDGNSVYECEYKVRCGDVNRNGDIRVDVLFDYFQEAANIHAEQLGCGFDALKERRIAWVLTRIRLDVIRTPKMGYTLKVRTWPSGFKRLYALREALFHDTNGDIAHLTSYWVLLDMEKMRPLRLPESLPISLPDNSDLPQFFDLGGRVESAGTDNQMSLTVPEHFIDINGHVNNARYWTLVSDWMSKCSGKVCKLASVTGHFLKETTAWTDVVVSGRFDGDAFAVQIAESQGEHSVHFVAEGRVDERFG